MKTNKLIALLLAMMMLLSALAACSKPATEDPGTTETPSTGTETPSTGTDVTPTAEKVYHETMNADIETLNAHATADSSMQTPYEYASSPLWRRVPTEDGTAAIYVGDLAVGDPEVDATGTVWTIHLNKDGKWNNGEPINADTWIYSYQMLIDPKLVNVMANFFFDNCIRIKGAKDYYYQGTDGYPATVTWDEVGMQKIDDYTLQLTTEGRFTVNDVKQHFADRSMYPVYEPYYEAGMNEDRTSTTYGATLDQWMGCGPYIFETWEPGAEHIYVKNADHWMADYFHFDRVELRVVSDINAKVTMWEKGEVDILSLNSSTLEQFRDDPRLFSYKNICVDHIDVNSLSPNPIMQTQEIRSALYWAINRTELAKLVGYAPAAAYINAEAGAFPDKGITYRETPEAKAVYPENEGYNPELANKYLDEAIAKAGVTGKVSIRFLYYTESDVYKKMAEYLAESLPKVFGEDRFELVVEGLPSNAMYDKVDHAAGAIDWDLTCDWWAASVSRVYPYKALRYFISEYSGRPNSYTSKRFDEQYAICDTEEVKLDAQRMVEETAKLEQIYLEDVVNIPVTQQISYVLYSERLILPCKQYIPGFGFGVMFADVAE